MPLDIDILSSRAAEMVRSLPKGSSVRVVSHYDADGISAAAIICQAVFRLGYGFHATLMRNPFDRGFEQLSKETVDLFIFSDMGSGQLDAIERLPAPAIILDHHQFARESTSAEVLQVNCNQCGINGNYEACGASMAYGFARALDEKENKDLIVYALAGAIGDKQHIGGFQGYNLDLVGTAASEGLVREHVGLKLYGKTIHDALFYAMDPYYRGISGNSEGVKRLIEEVGIDVGSSLEDLDLDLRRRLESYLYLQLMKAGCRDNILETAIRTRFYSEALGCDIERFADLLDACGKTGNRGLALSVCINPSGFFDEAVEVEKEYKSPVLKGLAGLEGDGLLESDSFSYFYSDRSSLGGVIAGIAENFILAGRKALVSLVRSVEKKELHVSARGSRELVERGLDVAEALRVAADDVGGVGGGHAIAAGATVPLDEEQAFLDGVEKVISGQLRK